MRKTGLFLIEKRQLRLNRALANHQLGTLSPLRRQERTRTRRSRPILQIPPQRRDARILLQTTPRDSRVPQTRPLPLEILHNTTYVRLHVLRPIGARETRDVLAAVRVNRGRAFAQRLQFGRLEFVERSQRTDGRSAVPQTAGRKALADARIEARFARSSTSQHGNRVFRVSEFEQVRARPAFEEGMGEHGFYGVFSGGRRGAGERSRRVRVF